MEIKSNRNIFKKMRHAESKGLSRRVEREWFRVLFV